MMTVPFALYDAFTDHAYGGSPVAIVADAAHLDGATRQKIAPEIGMPATALQRPAGMIRQCHHPL